MAGKQGTEGDAAALDRAAEVFWEKGYEATSIEDLLHRMAIGRGQFYSRFGGKAQLFLAVLDRYGDRVIGTLLSYLDGEASACRAIAGFFERLCDHAVSGGPLRGCLATNSAIEAGSSDAEVMDRVTVMIARIEACFRTLVDRGVQAGEFRADADAGALAAFLTCNMQGLLVMSKVGASPDSLRAVVRVVVDGLPVAPGGCPDQSRQGLP